MPLPSPLTPAVTLMSADADSVTLGAPVPSTLHGEVVRS